MIILTSILNQQQTLDFKVASCSVAELTYLNRICQKTLKSPSNLSTHCHFSPPLRHSPLFESYRSRQRDLHGHAIDDPFHVIFLRRTQHVCLTPNKRCQDTVGVF